MRDQISAKNMMWCQNPCRREATDHFFCDTLYGPDFCSPRAGVTYKAKNCFTPCMHHESVLEEYYYCYIDNTNNTWDYCGNWDVPTDKKSVVEFTRYDYVCGDYCKPDEDNTYEWCHYAYWDYNSTLNEAQLRTSWDYCRGHVPPGMPASHIAGIVIGVIAGIVIITLLIYYFTKN